MKLINKEEIKAKDTKLNKKIVENLQPHWIILKNTEFQQLISS